VITIMIAIDVGQKATQNKHTPVAKHGHSLYQLQV
jgi:hypothetical protein